MQPGIDVFVRLSEHKVAAQLLGAMRASTAAGPLYGADVERLTNAETTLRSQLGNALYDASPSLKNALRASHDVQSGCAGSSNADVALVFVLSPKIVRNHVSNIFTKLHVADRARAILRARDAGLERRGGAAS